MSGTERRRRRTRSAAEEPTGRPAPPAHRPAPPPAGDRAVALTSGVQDPEETVTAGGDEPGREDPTTERGLRGLVGGGCSQVSVSAALRARDAARPTAEDLANAEVNLPIVRRGWVPREDLPRAGGRPR